MIVGFPLLRGELPRFRRLALFRYLRLWLDLRGREWGALRGTLAVAALKGSRLLFMKFDDEHRLRWVRGEGR